MGGKGASTVTGGGVPAPGRAERTVFVTVGTTKFDALIRAVDQGAVADALAACGYTRLVMQVGASGYTPHRLFPPNSRVGRTHAGLAVEYFDYAPSLADHLASAALVISHAGSGSLFESLRARRPLIAVPNPLLMDNHQVGRCCIGSQRLWAGQRPLTCTLLLFCVPNPSGIFRASHSTYGSAPLSPQHSRLNSQPSCRRWACWWQHRPTACWRPSALLMNRHCSLMSRAAPLGS